MKNRSKISGGQLVWLLFTGRLSGGLLFTGDAFAGFSFTDCLWYCVCNALLLFVLFIPSLLVFRHNQGSVAMAHSFGKGIGKTVDTAYILLCVFVLALEMVQFADFARKSMKTTFSVPVLTVVFVTVCFLASLYGIQPLARCALVVGVFSLLCLLLFEGALFSEMRLLHFPPQQTGAVARIFWKAVRDLPRSAEVTVWGLLYPYINGSSTKTAGVFSAVTAVLTAVVSMTAIAVLGDFAGMTFYPYYTAVTASELVFFERMELLVVAVWLGTFFVRFTLFCQLLNNTTVRLVGKKRRIWVGILVFSLLVAGTLWIQQQSFVRDWKGITWIYGGFLLVFCVLLPLTLAVSKLWKQRMIREAKV